MHLIPIKTPILQKNTVSDLIKIINQDILINSGDTLVITTKLISYDENRLVKLKNVKVSRKALDLAKKYSIHPAMAQLCLDESDEICGGAVGALLTLKNNILIANTGIDQSNVPKGFAALWPKNPTQSAERIKNRIKKEFNVDIAVILADSHCLPLRRGTSAIAIAIAGFEGVIDIREKPDLFGRKLKITLVNLADQLASSANILMGEAREQIPAVLIKDAPIKLSKKKALILTKALIIERSRCLFREYNLKNVIK